MQNQSLPQQQQFEVIFNCELYENLVDANSLNCNGFLRQSICYTSEIMICDLILLLESGQLNNEKLNISGYFKLMNLIQEFRQNQAKCNQHNILKYCLIMKKNEGNFQMVSKMNLQINYPSLTDQIDELQAKLSQFVDQTKGKDLDEILNQAFLIYSKFKLPIQKMKQENKEDEMFFCIQNRFFIKQYLLKQSSEEQQKSLKYFKEIYNVIKNQPYFYQILNLLIEADFKTLEYIIQFVQNDKILEFKNQEVSIINDFELNNYFLVNLQNAEQIIKDKNVQTEWLKSENKIQFFQNILNFQNLQGNQLRNYENNNQKNPYFSKFQKALIKKLKIKFWIFLDELNENSFDVFNDEIFNIFKKYQISIILKLENQQHFEKFIKIILDCDEMEKVIEKILEYKIKLIHECVQDNLKNKQTDLSKKLDELYQMNKRIYLPQLKNHPSLIQQVDIILDYCSRIQIMIQIDSNQRVNFRNTDQLKILQMFYQSMDHQTELDEELLQLTNRFCPNLSISKSTQFQIYLKKIEQKISKQKLLEQFNFEQKSEIKLKNLNYNSLNIYKLMKKPQNFDQLLCALYENTTWDNFQNSLIQESQKQIEISFKKSQENNFNQEKAKMQNQYEQLLFIPIQWIDTIFKNSFEENKQKEIMEKILQFFNKLRDEEQKILTELQVYVKLNNEFINNLEIQKKQHFKSLDNKDYQSIEEMEEDVKNKNKIFQNQQFDKQYQIKNLIENIHNQYSKNCMLIFLKPLLNLKKYKLDNQNEEESDIKKKIMDFYSNQLMENLRLQLQNIQLQ